MFVEDPFKKPGSFLGLSQFNDLDTCYSKKSKGKINKYNQFIGKPNLNHQQKHLRGLLVVLSHKTFF